MNKNKPKIIDLKKNFFENEKILKDLYNLDKKLNISYRPYYLFIRKINSEFVYEASNLLFELQFDYNQPYILTKNSISNILKFFLPFPFFLCLSKNEAISVKQKILENENLSAFVIAKKREPQNCCIYTFSDNYYDLDFNKIDKLDDNLIMKQTMEFLDYYQNFKNENFLSYLTNYKKHLLDLLSNKPIIIFNELTLSQAIFIVNNFNQKLPDIWFDLLICEDNLLKRKSVNEWD